MRPFAPTGASVTPMALIVLWRPLMGAGLASFRGDAGLAQRTVRTELACARALLDELETVLDAQNEEQTRSDVVLQVADQLARVASTLKQSGTRRGDERAVRGGFMIIGSNPPPEDDRSESTSAMTHGFDRALASSASFGHNEGDMKK